MVLITHRELTMDPPQKWFPFLHKKGQRSHTRSCAGSHTVRGQTHLSLRLTVHGEFPGIPLTMRTNVGWTRSSRFPHSVNSTFSAHTQRRCIIAWRRARGCRRLPLSSDFISSETNLLVHSWAPSLQLW